VLATTCDQMRRAPEQIARESAVPVFLMNVPATWQTAAAYKLYVSELERLGRFLVRLGGAKPSPDGLARVMREYEAVRLRLRDARGALSPRSYSEAIAAFNSSGTTDLDSIEGRRRASGVPVALVGGPLMRHHFDIFDLVETCGGTVVLDASDTGERTMSAPLDRRTLRGDPLAALAEAYFGNIPDAFRRPNSLLYQWLKREMADRGVRGIIFLSHTWCDMWLAEAQRMKEWSEVPLVAVTADSDESARAHTASRIESFLEMLR